MIRATADQAGIVSRFNTRCNIAASAGTCGGQAPERRERNPRSATCRFSEEYQALGFCAFQVTVDRVSESVSTSRAVAGRDERLTRRECGRKQHGHPPAQLPRANFRRGFPSMQNVSAGKHRRRGNEYIGTHPCLKTRNVAS